MEAVKTEILTPVKQVEAPAVAEYVLPTELCDTQRRSMARDAFAALQARGY